jgi:hypothetical protein
MYSLVVSLSVGIRFLLLHCTLELGGRMQALPVQPRWRTFPIPFLLWAKGGMSNFMLPKMTPLLSTRRTSQILLIHPLWILEAVIMLGHDLMSTTPSSTHTKIGLTCINTQ